MSENTAAAIARPPTVLDRIVERNRLLWLALNEGLPIEERRDALERALAPDPFEVLP